MTVDYRIFDRDKFTVVGSPTITDDGIASGFSSGNYLTTPIIDLSKPFEIKFYYNTGDSFNSSIPVFGSSDRNYLRFRADSFQFILSELNLNNTAWVTVQTNTTYYVIYYWNGSEYGAKIYKPDGTLLANPKVNSSTPCANSKITLGKCSWSGDYVRGSIDLKQFSIEVDGEEVFSGSHKGTITDKLIYLNDTKQIIKSAIEAKGVEVSTETPFRQYADKIGEISGGGYQPYTKTPNVIYASSDINNDYNTLYRGIWTKSYRRFTNTDVNLMYANTPLDFNKKFEFLFHLNLKNINQTARIAVFSETNTNEVAQFGIDSSHTVYADIKQNDTDTSFISYNSEAICNANTDYFIKIIYNGLNKLEIFLSTDNKSFQKLGENTITINYTNLCRIYFCCSKNTSSVIDLNGTIDFNYVNFLYPDNPENNWYAMS